MGKVRAFTIIMFSFLSWTSFADDARPKDLNRSPATLDLPPELMEMEEVGKKTGFLDILSGSNINGFSASSVDTGILLNHGLEYAASAHAYSLLWGEQPTFFTSKQNIYYPIVSGLPLSWNAEATFQTNTNPVYDLGVRWAVTSTEAIKKLAESIGFSYSIVLRPAQFDSKIGYGWQIENDYWMSLPNISFIKGAYVRGEVDFNGNNSDVSEKYIGKLFVPIEYGFSAYADYRHSANKPLSTYNGLSFGLEYSLGF